MRLYRLVGDVDTVLVMDWTPERRTVPNALEFARI